MGYEDALRALLCTYIEGALWQDFKETTPPAVARFVDETDQHKECRPEERDLEVRIQLPPGVRFDGLAHNGRTHTYHLWIGLPGLRRSDGTGGTLWTP